MMCCMIKMLRGHYFHTQCMGFHPLSISLTVGSVPTWHAIKVLGGRYADTGVMPFASQGDPIDLVHGLGVM